jgi:hypothetical protein
MDLTDGESSGLSVLSVVSVFAYSWFPSFGVRLELFRKAVGSKTGAQIPEGISSRSARGAITVAKDNAKSIAKGFA